MKYGIELEIVRGDVDDLREALHHDKDAIPTQISLDGSLPGFNDRELKPDYPLTAHQVPSWVNHAVTSAKKAGYGTSNRCGLHYHFDRESMPVYVRDNFTLLLACWARAAAYRVVGSSLFGTSIRRLQYSEYTSAPGYSLIARGARDGAHAFSSHAIAVSYSLNWDTIEVRMPSGSLCEKRILRTLNRLRIVLALAYKNFLSDEFKVLRTAVYHEALFASTVYAIAKKLDAAVRLIEKQQQQRQKRSLQVKAHRIQRTPSQGKAEATLRASEYTSAPGYSPIRALYSSEHPYCGVPTYCGVRSPDHSLVCTRSVEHVGEHGATDIYGGYTDENNYWPNEAEGRVLSSALSSANPQA